MVHLDPPLVYYVQAQCKTEGGLRRIVKMFNTESK